MSRKISAGSVVFVGIFVFSLGAFAAPADGGAKVDLSSMIPPDAVFWIERSGHTAVKPAFEGSNLGRLMKDAEMNAFLQGSRVKIGRLIVREMFDLEMEEDIASSQKTLHEFLLPFWHNPCAMFVAFDKDMKSAGMGFYCVTGKYQPSCKSAVEKLMKMGVPPEGTAGERQMFTHTSGGLTWTGVAKRREEWTLAADAKEQAEQIKDASLFMVAWSGDLMLIATDLHAADTATHMLPGSPDRPESKSASAGYKAVLAQTRLKDWAIRWHLDMEKLNEYFEKQRNGFFAMGGMLASAGLEDMRSIGGVGGYADGVYTRLTFVDAPKPSGILSLLSAGGSYKQALALLPQNCPLAVAGQLDANAVPRWVRQSMIASKQQMQKMRARFTRQMHRDGEQDDEDEPATMPAVTLDEDEEKILKQIQTICQSSTGAAAVAITQLPNINSESDAGISFCVVIGLKDSAAAGKFIDDLIKENDYAGLEPVKHRNVAVRTLNEDMITAVLKDRLIFAGNMPAMKAAIDVALNKPTDAPSGSMAKMTALTGDGSAIIQFDMPVWAKLVLPMMTPIAGGEDSPFAQFPAADKMAGLLGPEIIVIEPTKGGWLFKSKGTVPLFTKMLTVQGPGLWYVLPMMMGSHSRPVPSGPSGPAPVPDDPDAF